MRPHGGPLVALALVAAACGCDRKPPDEVAPALALFELAREDEPRRERLGRVIDDRLLDHDNPELLEALERLRPAARPEVLAVEPLNGLGRVAIDLRATLPGRASAVFSVHTAPVADAGWRVIWFQGPDLGWPELPAGPPGVEPGASPPPEGAAVAAPETG